MTMISVESTWLRSRVPGFSVIRLILASGNAEMHRLLRAASHGDLGRGQVSVIDAFPFDPAMTELVVSEHPRG
jgi:hypothetical protein